MRVAPTPAPARPAPLDGAYSPSPAETRGPLPASPAAQRYASVFVEGSSAPLELPPVPASSAAPVSLPPLAADAGQTRLSHRPPARFSTVLEPSPADALARDAVAPRLAQTAWEVPPGTEPAGVVGKPPPQPSGLSATSLEALALRGLRELAGSLIPGQPLEHAGDVIQLITKLHDAVEMFCRCFIPVREACSRFIPLPDLEQAALERCRYRSSAYLAIERALEPRAVAAALIDWRNEAQDAPAAVENILADLMLHHLALSQGVIEGIHTLLEELSPARLEAETAEQPSVLSKLGLASARERALWEAYSERHARLAAAGDAFRDVFGAELTRAFQAHWQRRGGGDTSAR